MPKVKEQKVKTERRKSRNKSPPPQPIKKYILDSGMEESSNNPNPPPSRESSKNTTKFQKLLSNMTFQEIEGLHFREKGQPIYHTVFIEKGTSKVFRQEFSTDQMAQVENILGKNLSYEYLKSLLLLMRNEEEEMLIHEQSPVQLQQKE